MSLTVGLLAKWLFVMKQNHDYFEYCNAVAENDLAKCHELQSKFDRLETLYADWGEIELVADDPESESFKQWLKPRESLFFNNVEIKSISDPRSYVPTQGHLLLEIPLLDTKSKTIEALREYIDKVYDAAQHDTYDSTNDLGLRLRAKPKYQLFGQYNKKTEGRLRKALYFRYWLEARPVLKKGKLYWGNLSISEIVRALKMDPNNPFGWTMNEDDERALKNGRNRSVKTIFIDTERTQIKRSITDLQGYIHNTIHGRFPDPSPAR
jgi:hypothetical protein